MQSVGRIESAALILRYMPDALIVGIDWRACNVMQSVGRIESAASILRYMPDALIVGIDWRAYIERSDLWKVEML